MGLKTDDERKKQTRGRDGAREKQEAVEGRIVFKRMSTHGMAMVMKVCVCGTGEKEGERMDFIIVSIVFWTLEPNCNCVYLVINVQAKRRRYRSTSTIHFIHFVRVCV